MNGFLDCWMNAEKNLQLIEVIHQARLARYGLRRQSGAATALCLHRAMGTHAASESSVRAVNPKRRRLPRERDLPPQSITPPSPPCPAQAPEFQVIPSAIRDPRSSAAQRPRWGIFLTFERASFVLYFFVPGRLNSACNPWPHQIKGTKIMFKNSAQKC